MDAPVPCPSKVPCSASEWRCPECGCASDSKFTGSCPLCGEDLKPWCVEVGDDGESPAELAAFCENNSPPYR